jgi:dTDP-4-dehydrorhamnose reductase
MLGHDMVEQLDELGIEHVDSDVECSILDLDAIRAFVSGKSIEWIINCSGYTAVDKAEAEEAKADAINALGSENLGRIAVNSGARIIHFSTDYIFDGEASEPYEEDSPPSPRSAYGRTKARGEILLRAVCPEHFIVRTAWLYGIHGGNFVHTMLRLMNERDEVSVVEDQRGSPTYTKDLSRAICEIIQKDSREFGTYHFTNEGETSWFEFARSIYEIGRSTGKIAKACTVVPVSSDGYPTKTVRPKYSVLSKAKFRRTFKVVIPTWRDGLERFFRELGEEG